MANKLVICPYDEAHKVKESRLSLHITKCRQNHLNTEKFTCSFNASHILPYQERDYHLMNCPDKVVVDRAIAFKSLEKNNPFKGNTSVPSYTASVPVISDEVWDDGIEEIEPAPGFVPPDQNPFAIFEPPALSKPSQRRKLYQELHGRPTECEKNLKQALEAEPKFNLEKCTRQPKARSEVENKTSSEFHHLGLGRGKPTAAPSRIAANIFAPTPASQPAPTNNANYSAALSGMNRLGFGRGYSTSTTNTNSLDDDFPALGCGRGVYRTTKSDIRYPGSRT